MIKLIASDMDGTLLDNKHKISQDNINAIKKAQELGIHFTIVTGRDYESVKSFVENLDLNCEYIVLSGAEYRDRNGNVVSSITMDKAKAKEVIELMDKEGLGIEVFTDSGVYVLDREKISKQLVDIIKLNNLNIGNEEILKYNNILNSAKEIVNLEDFINSNIKVYRICTFDKNTDLIAKVKENINLLKGLAVSGTFFNDIEINHIDAQKGLILAKVIKEMGIERDEVIVLGDSFNDYSLFKEFDNSFAMENAIPEIKAIAKYITDSNENSGVAKAIYKSLNM